MLERIDIEAFLTLAEELHFGRTAERLHVTTGRISQTIKKLERHVGGQLFERTSRRVTLTELGRQLHDDLRPGYEQIEAGIERAINTGRGIGGVLRVGFIGAAAGQLMIEAVHLFDDRHPDCHVELRELQIYDALPRLRAGDVEILIGVLPVMEPELATGPPLFSDSRMLAVPSPHPLAGRDSVSLEDLADDKLVQLPDAVPSYWRDDYTPRRTPAGKPIEPGPTAQTFQEVLALVSAGEGVFPVGAQVTRYYTRPDVVYIPFRDAPPIKWGPIWLGSEPSARIRAFNRAARDAAQART